jgi:hypothetical protein
MADKPSTPTIDVELGRRLHKALTATTDELFQVILDPDMQVLRSSFKNPSLNEDHLLALLKRRDLTEDLLKAVYQLETAKSSHRLHLALVKNPGTPTRPSRARPAATSPPVRAGGSLHDPGRDTGPEICRRESHPATAANHRTWQQDDPG